jgi:hypothetical protein
MPDSCHGSGTEVRTILLMIFSLFPALGVLDARSLLYCTSLIAFGHFSCTRGSALGPRHLSAMLKHVAALLLVQKPPNQLF